MPPKRIFVPAALIIAAGLLAASAAASTGRPALAQAEDATEELPPPVAELSLGQRFSGPGWDVEVQDAFVVQSPDRTGWSEVRAAIAIRPTGAPLPYLWNGPTGELNYPALAIRDAAGETHSIPVTDPVGHLVPGSALSIVPPGIPAHWTVGFEVPTPFADDLVIEVAAGDTVLAGWDLSSSRAPLTGWEPVSGLAISELNEPIPWSDDLEVTPIDHTTLACGNPLTQQVTVGYGLVVEVSNEGVDDAAFPDVLYPDVAGLAIWHDGSSARYSSQTHLITEEEPVDPLRTESIERVMIPPQTTYERMMIFILPRDGRFASIEAAPEAVILAPPGGEPVWLDVSAVPGSDGVSFLDCGDVIGGHPFDVDQDGEVIQPVPVPASTGDGSTP